jgi:hypothetical protein
MKHIKYPASVEWRWWKNQGIPLTVRTLIAHPVHVAADVVQTVKNQGSVELIPLVRGAAGQRWRLKEVKRDLEPFSCAYRYLAGASNAKMKLLLPVAFSA